MELQRRERKRLETERIAKQKSKWVNFRAAMLDMFETYKKLGIHVKEILEDRPFPCRPLESRNANKFFYAVKKENVFKIRRLLATEKYIVYQYDNVRKFSKNDFSSSIKRPCIGLQNMEI